MSALTKPNIYELTKLGGAYPQGTGVRVCR